MSQGHKDWSKPFQREMTSDEVAFQQGSETEFERALGVNRMEVRKGYSSIELQNLGSDPTEKRLGILRKIEAHGVSLDFLKLTRTGMSFVVLREFLDRVKETLGDEFDLAIGMNRAVLLVHAINIRDDEGLLARVVSEVLATGAEIHHMGDMHDRLLLVLDESQTDLVVESLRGLYPEAVV